MPYFFYFTLSLLQNTHISLSILQDISIKYSFFSIFFIISLNYPLPTYAYSLSLFTHFFWTNHLSLSFLPSLILSQKLPTQITSSPSPFFTGRSRSFLHWPIHEPSSTTQILSSPADPRTKLHDPDHFFTGRSTNQAPQPSYRSNLPGLFLDPSTQIAGRQQQLQQHPQQPHTIIGKRNLSDYQAHQFQNHQAGLNGFFYRSVKPHTYTSPISPL